MARLWLVVTLLAIAGEVLAQNSSNTVQSSSDYTPSAPIPDWWTSDTNVPPTRTAIQAVTFGSSGFTRVPLDFTMGSYIASLFPNMDARSSSELDSALQCASSIRRWRTIPANWTGIYTQSTVTPFSMSVTYNKTLWPDAKTVTECDGVPRLTFTAGTPSSIIYNYTAPEGITGVASSTWFLAANPPCTVPNATYSSYCSHMMRMDSALNSKYDSARNRGTVFTDLPDWYLTGCGGNYRDYCQMRVHSAHLNYWPVEPRKGGMCATTTPGFNMGNMTGVTTTATINGTEYIYPSIYVTYYGINYRSTTAVGEFYSYTTYTTPSLVASFHPNDVSSLCGPYGDKITRSFDFNDLSGPAPWSAYRCMSNCWGNSSDCLPMNEYATPYKPVLVWPTTFLDLLNRLNTKEPDLCEFGFDDNGIWDPPQLLTLAPNLKEPTTQPSITLTATTSMTSPPASPSAPVEQPAQPTTSAGPAPSPTKNDPPVQTSSTAPGQGAGQPPSPDTTKSPGIGDAIISMINGPRPQPQPQPPQNGGSGNAPSDPADPSESANPPSNPGGIGGAIISMINQPPSSPRDPINPNDPIGSSPGPATVPTQAIIPIANGGGPITALPIPAGALIGSKTLVPGSVLQTANQHLSLAPNGDGIVVVPAPPDTSDSNNIDPANPGRAPEIPSSSSRGSQPAPAPSPSTVLFSAPPSLSPVVVVTLASTSQPRAVVTVGGQPASVLRNADGTMLMDTHVWRAGEVAMVGTQRIEFLEGGVRVDGGQVVPFSSGGGTAGGGEGEGEGGDVTMRAGEVTTVGGRVVEYGSGGVVVDGRTVTGEAWTGTDGRVVRVGTATVTSAGVGAGGSGSSVVTTGRVGGGENGTSTSSRRGSASTTAVGGSAGPIGGGQGAVPSASGASGLMPTVVLAIVMILGCLEVVV
ncbi:hypothetical protein CAC42_7993 [Sphaceloma murrayae]|uniref:Uncharacterized protein n=1 Tax=Sphaceloma murrayae TaxID=2082308 RepID=A0A2K1QL59_9PEZI|nr:hypothetical protein CAC42_7993 [Sphaceloma murrayae]